LNKEDKSKAILEKVRELISWFETNKTNVGLTTELFEHFPQIAKSYEALYEENHQLKERLSLQIDKRVSDQDCSERSANRRSIECVKLKKDCVVMWKALNEETLELECCEDCGCRLCKALDKVSDYS